MNPPGVEIRKDQRMKIRDVKTYRLDAVLAEPFAYSQAWYDRRGALLVEIVSDDGLSGWGEAFGPPSDRADRRVL
jgi:L-alanine-DL-glutamate epimerase-like enolase superfamily enzyme